MCASLSPQERVLAWIERRVGRALQTCTNPDGESGYWYDSINHTQDFENVLEAMPTHLHGLLRLTAFPADPRCHSYLYWSTDLQGW